MTKKYMRLQKTQDGGEEVYEIADARKIAFLEHFAICGNITQAALKTGIGINTPSRWLQSDSTFADAFAQAHKTYGDRIRETINKRAIEGVEKVVLYRGKPVVDDKGNPIVEITYSDVLLTMLARAHLPEYKDMTAPANPYGIAITEYSLMIPDVRKLSSYVLEILTKELERIQLAEIEEKRKTTTHATNTVESEPTSKNPESEQSQS